MFSSPPLPLPQPVLDLAASLPNYVESDALAVTSRLRSQGFDAEVVAQALQLSRLRAQAAYKFGDLAGRLAFTSDGLQQASRAEVSARHARVMAAAGVRSVADLGCGIGSESLAFLRQGLCVTAVELDSATASFAAHNLGQVAPSDCWRVLVGDARRFDLAAVDAFFADPARRSSGSRIAQPDQWLPPLPDLLDLATSKPAGIKVAPGIGFEWLPPSSRADFVSCGGSAVEACIWTGRLASSLGGPGRSAVVFRGGREFVLDAEVGSPDLPSPLVPSGSGAFLYEPDPAVVRSGAMSALASEFALGTLDPHLAFLCGDVNPRSLSSDAERFSALVQSFEILERCPLRAKPIKAACQRAGIGYVDVLVRGVQVEPQQLRKQLKLKGSGQRGAVLAARVGDDHFAYVCRPVSAN